jgi:hypothetical protein
MVCMMSRHFKAYMTSYMTMYDPEIRFRSDELKIPPTTTSGCSFRMHLLAWKKTFRQYGQFQKQSPG